MATLTPTLTLASTDLTSETLNLSVTDSLTISKAVKFSRVTTSSSGDTTILANATYTKSYVYLKNLDSSIVINVDFGSQIAIALGGGEFAFFPWESAADVVVRAASGSPKLEFAAFEA